MQEEIKAVLKIADARGLPCMLIGGNAVILLGYIRNTLDLDLMVPITARSRWLDVLSELGYRLFNGTEAFVQFEAAHSPSPPVDLMFVQEATWEKMSRGAQEHLLAGESVLVPRPEFLVAMKLHSASSPTRSKPETDWEDIRQIVRICGLDPADETFRELILRYGGESALARIENFTR